METTNEIKQLHKELINCRLCKKSIETRQLNCPFLGLGNFNSNIMFVGERPGFQPTKTGIVFEGNRSGNLFLKVLSELNLTFNHVYITNIVKCQCEDNKTPDFNDIINCIKYLKKEISIIKPKLIVCVGFIAYNHLDNLYNNMVRIYHPSYILRVNYNLESYVNDIKLKIKDYL